MSMTSPEWREFWRWSICGAVVLCAHAGAAAAIAYWPERAPPAEPSAALVLEMAALPAAPEVPETEKPPAPQEEEITNDTPPDPVVEEAKVEPEPDLEPPIEETPPEPQLEEPPPEPPPPEITQADKPEVAIAMPEKPKPKKKQPPRKQAAAPKPIQSARIAPAAAPSQGLPSLSNSNAIPDWRSRVSAQLERNKRLPPGADRGDSGSPKIAFRLDRRGNVLSVQLVRSSGSPVFDQEAVALARRAAPFPPPPSEIRDAQLNMTVSINFNRR